MSELKEKLKEEEKANHKMVVEILELKETIEKLTEDKRKMLVELYKANDKYDKEKEKNASLQKEIKLMKSININENYISKDKIRELLKRYDKGIAWANADDHYYFTKFIEELLKENTDE